MRIYSKTSNAYKGIACPFFMAKDKESKGSGRPGLSYSYSYSKHLHLSQFRYKLPNIEAADGKEQWNCTWSVSDNLLADSIYEGYGTPISPLHFDSKFNISLPLYPQIRIELEPLPKAIYILFLRHPEGIVLKDIHMYEEELRSIYRAVSGRKNPSVTERIFKRVTNPTENQLHRSLTVIRKCFTSRLDYETAWNYIPAHNRAKAHSIPLDTTLIELPDIG